MKRWKAYLVVCTILLLCGCSSGQTRQTHAKASPTASIPAHTPTPFAVNLTPLTMQQAWGQVQISQFSLDLGDHYFGPNAQRDGITDDGQICGSTGLARTQGVDLSKDSESVGLINVHTGHVTLLTTMPAGYSQMYCTVTGPWVIWTETSGSTFESFDAHWIIKAYNRQTGEVIKLDQGHAPDGQHPYASFVPQPDASNGRVVWTTYSEDTPGSIQSEMYTFATGTKTVLADRASYPLISWPWVSWAGGTGPEIVFKNLQTMQQVRLPMTYPPGSAAFGGTCYVFTDLQYSQVNMVPSILAQPMGSYVIEDMPSASGFVEFPSLNDRLISWVGLNSWLVFDRKLQRPVKIAIGANGLSGFISSHYLVATPALTQADLNAQRQGLPYHHVMFVIDTNTLP